MSRDGVKASHCKRGHPFSEENTSLIMHSRDGHTYQRCRTCSRAAAKRREQESHYLEEYQLQRRYGISIAERDALFKAQDGRCALCERPAETIDHDHETGEVRGMLCRACNVALGVLGDSTGSIQRVLAYLGDAPRKRGLL